MEAKIRAAKSLGNRKATSPFDTVLSHSCSAQVIAQTHQPLVSAALPAEGFLRLPGVLAVIPVCKSAWWAGIKTGKYPKPIKLGPKTSAWRVEDIRTLIAAAGNAANDASKASA